MAEIKFGWHMPSFPIDGAPASAFVDQVGAVLDRYQDDFDSAWMDDHFVPWASWQGEETPYLECVTTMAYLAGTFTRIRFGSSVLCQSYRNPALLAKMGANLQLLTQGRFIFGIGAGWLEKEYRAYGYAFPRPAVRVAQLEETVEIVKRMWTEAPVTYHGKHYRVEGAYCVPRPDPVPPILIGGGGEQLTLRVVAKHADWWNIPGGTLENYTHKLNVLRRHCEAVGRNYEEIVKTWSAESIAVAESEAEARRLSAETPFQNGPIAGTPAQVAEKLQPFIDAGVEHLIVRLVDFPRMEGLELFVREVMPRLRGA